jgi:hypothetical protein
MAAVDELVEHIVSTVGIEHDVAEKAVGIILDFLIKEAPDDAVNKLLDAFPGGRSPRLRWVMVMERTAGAYSAPWAASWAPQPGSWRWA